jgi:DNA-binding IclR family transcriptional regulator
MVLTKQAALEYLARTHRPVTAKILAIDLDSRASTASELLERMTAQGLTERDPNQRPREYTLTDSGWKQAELFASNRAAPSPSLRAESGLSAEVCGEGQPSEAMSR